MAHASLSLRAGGHLGITPCTSTARRPVPFSAGAGGCRHAVSVCRAPTHCRRSAADEPAAADDAGLAALFSQTVRVKGIPSPVAAVQSAQPSPLVPPHAVVHQILDVLQRNDYPDQDAGVTAAFQLTAPAEDPQHAGTVRSWFAGGESWLPLPRFHALLHTAYRPLLNCDSWRPLSPLVFPSTRHDNKAAARRRAAAEAAAAHRERHRYRCSACRGDFCDLCGAAPYHGGLTCTQARSPECLMCGDPVEQRERLTALLPVAAAAVARDEDGDGGDAGEAEGGPGRDGAGAQDGSGAAAAVGPWAAAVVRRAGRGELLRALRGALDMDTSWCLERRDLERALLHYGCRTCAAPDCADKRAAMCGLPLPCGHWCCGLRHGRHADVPEPEPGSHPHQGHPRCVECGADPITGAAPAGAAAAAAAAAGTGTGGAGAGLGRGRAAAGAAVARDCCYCQEPLRSAPCIELGCGRRHACHLACASARLRAGYPGPHISFGHLYCPLCRDSDPAAGSNLQAALGPVHLDHPALALALAPHLSLREAVAGAARQRLRLDAQLKADPALRPGGKYDGRPADFALERLLFYKCSKCAKPYFGGARACGAQAEDGEDGGGGGHRADELVCGDCCAQAAGTNCAKHGTAYIEWKCKYCCSMATWFCFGTTHMCNKCHQDPFNLRGVGRDGGGGAGAGGAGGGGGAAECRDPRCSLRARSIPHPPPGQEACLGCGMCRAGL